MWTARQRWKADGSRRRRQASSQHDFSGCGTAFTFQVSRTVVAVFFASIANLPTGLPMNNPREIAVPDRLTSTFPSEQHGTPPVPQMEKEGEMAGEARPGERPSPWLGAALVSAVTFYGLAARRSARRRREREGYGYHADKPQQIPKRGWWEVLRRTWSEIGEDNISHLAAGVGFYALIAIFPAFGALVALYGLIANPADVERHTMLLAAFMPAESLKLLTDALHNLVAKNHAGLSVGLVVSVLIAIWSARVGTGALMTALNVAYGEREKRNFIWFNAVALALTGGLVLFGIIAIFTVAVIPAALHFLPFPESWTNLISAVRWPILFVLVMLALAVIYRIAPSREQPRWQWVSPGALGATVLWVIGSALFSLYVGRFGSYNETYGSLGAVVVLLLWFWLSSYIILAGAELNAELERQTARDTTTGAPRPMGARGARMADTVATGVD
jgi:membrane protein